MAFNFNVYSERTSHIPSTRFDFTRLGEYNVCFLFNSIYQKMVSLKADKNIFSDLALLVNKQFNSFADTEIENNQSEKNRSLLKSNYYLTDEELQVLSAFNIRMKKFLYFDFSPNEDVNDELIDHYLRSSGKNLESIKEGILSPNDDVYPYKLNIVDTGVPTDLYYKFVYINENTLIILVFDQFLEHLSSNIKNYYFFIKQLLIKEYEQLNIAEVAATPVFSNYIKMLGTTYV